VYLFTHNFVDCVFFVLERFADAVRVVVGRVDAPSERESTHNTGYETSSIRNRLWKGLGCTTCRRNAGGS